MVFPRIEGTWRYSDLATERVAHLVQLVAGGGAWMLCGHIENTIGRLKAHKAGLPRCVECDNRMTAGTEVIPTGSSGDSSGDHRRHRATEERIRR